MQLSAISYNGQQARQRLSLITLILAFLLAWVFFVLIAPVQVAEAQSVPDVTYTRSKNLLTIGRPYSVTISAEAPFVGYPNKPGAPKLRISLPQILALVQVKYPSQFNDILVQENTGIWFIKASVSVEQNAFLDLSSSQFVSEVRLESTTTTTPSIIMVDGGQLLIQGIKLYSWDPTLNGGAGGVDTTFEASGGAPPPFDLRAYIATLRGGRTDILSSELSYLGWEDIPATSSSTIGQGEPSGLAWRLRASDTISDSGPRGSIIDSNVHHNYMGAYVSAGLDLQITGSKIHDNASFGLYVRDSSTNATVDHNEVYNSNLTGVYFSRQSTNSKITNNNIHDNGLAATTKDGNGITLDRGSNNIQIIGNNINNTKLDGIFVLQSSNTQILNNTINNSGQNGLRVSAVYADNPDRFDALAIDSIIRQNKVLNSGQLGIALIDRTDRTTIVDNIVLNSGQTGLWMNTGLNTVRNNVVSFSGQGGIFLDGTVKQIAPGQTPYTPPISLPGHKTSFDGNAIEFNNGTGLDIKLGLDNTIGKDAGNEIRANKQIGVRLVQSTSNTLLQDNVIHLNGQDGIFLNGTTTLYNKITRNSISGNTGFGINKSNANGGLSITPPTFIQIQGNKVTGFGSKVGTTVEVYRDAGDEGMFYLGFAKVTDSLSWEFTLPTDDDPAQGKITTLAIYDDGNTSQFSTPTVIGAETQSASAEANVADVAETAESNWPSSHEEILRQEVVQSSEENGSRLLQWLQGEAIGESESSEQVQQMLLPYIEQ